MLLNRLAISLITLNACWSVAVRADEAAYRLSASQGPGSVSNVTVSLDVGGEVIVLDADGKETRMPLSTVAKLVYQEQILAWSADPATPSRSLRRYTEAESTRKTDLEGSKLALRPDRQLIVAEVVDARPAHNGLDHALSRDEHDLIDAVGNSLVLDRLLPDRELKASEGWDHDAETIGALLDMDHVAVCEVRSVVTGEENRQVQIRLTGAVHGTVEGAATEIELRGAYLYHLDEHRITKFNLAVKEKRKPGEVTPGLDVVAKISLVAAPSASKRPPFDQITLERARTMTSAALGELLVDAPERGYRFRHDASWYVTGEKRELLSLGQLVAGDLLAHCNVVTLPARSPEKALTLQEFEKNVCDSLDKKVDKVAAATEWTTAAGYKCLGVFANGAVDEVPVQWRYYHLASDAGDQATLSVTIEQSLLERFADADRAIVESVELLPLPASTAAAEPAAATK